MHADRFSLKARRTTRIPIRIPVLVVIEEGGKTRSLDGWTMLVNVHGAKIECKHRFGLHEDVIIQVPFNGMSQQGKVVWSKSEVNENGNYEIGVELDRPDNLWGVGFPPSDWESGRGGKASNATSSILDLAPAEAEAGANPAGDWTPSATENEPAAGNNEMVPAEVYSSAPEQLGKLLDLTEEMSALNLEANLEAPPSANVVSEGCETDIKPVQASPLEEEGPMSTAEISYEAAASQRQDIPAPYREIAAPGSPASLPSAIAAPVPASATAPAGQTHPTDRLSAFFNELVDSALQAKLASIVEAVEQRIEARATHIEASTLSRVEEQAQNTGNMQIESMEQRSLEFFAARQQTLQQNVENYLVLAEAEARQRQQQLLDQNRRVIQDELTDLLRFSKQRLEQNAADLLSTTQLGLRSSMEQQLPSIEKDLLERCRTQSQAMMAAQLEQWILLFSDRVQEAQQSLQKRLDGTVEELVMRQSAAVEMRFEELQTQVSARLEQQLNRIGTQVRQAFLRHIVTELGRGQQVWIQQAQRQLEQLTSQNLERTRQNLSQFMKSLGDSLIQQATTESDAPGAPATSPATQIELPVAESVSADSSQPQC